MSSEWSTLTTLNSDHLPILILLGSTYSTGFPEPPHRTFTNLKKADWGSFTSEIERRFSLLSPPSSCSTGEAQFRLILLRSAKHHIPTGHIPNMIPNLSDPTKSLISQRDTLRQLHPTDPHIHALDRQIANNISETNRHTWTHTVESCSHKQNINTFWALIKSLAGKRPYTPPNQPITFAGKTLTQNREIASAFTKQFTQVVPHTHDPTTRHVKRRLLKECPLDTNISPFTTQTVLKVIRNSGNSRAAGPDGLTIHHLKHLGPTGLQYLTDIFNLSFNHSNIPAIWKHATIVPVLKPGKQPGSGTSYRPISLLCPAVKVLERLLLPELALLPISPTQHGFRPNHSTTTALLPLTQHIARGFNQHLPPLRTLTMSIDFSKAFDMVNHTKLISSLINTPLRPNTVRWLSAYLYGRTASCRYNNTTSPSRHSRTGVPQGSVISPALFNHFVSSYPQSDLLSSSYADDFTDSISGPTIPPSAETLSAHAESVFAWAEEKGLSISAPKSTITLFTSDRHQSHTHPQVTLNNSPLPLERNPRILGVTFDPHFTFTPHITSLISRATSRLNILKALAGTNWGQHKETIIITYKSLIRSLFTYATPIWFPNTNPTILRRLQTIQNSALRIATGCVKMSAIDHLHAETQVLPVESHLSLLCSQFLARALQPNHPSHLTVTSPSGPRNKKHTLQSRFLPDVDPYLVDGTIPPHTYKAVLKSLHTAKVANTLTSRDPNRVLQIPPPPIGEEESSLPRPYRTTLSQLRSGFCRSLNSYQVRIGTTNNPLCPSCDEEPHTTQHLFTCPSHPTFLTPRDLWERPGLTSEFLSSLPFLNLPPLP